jgi:hypothetical protein
MNKTTSVQIVFVGIIMALVSTVFFVAQQHLPKHSSDDDPYDPNRPQWQTALESDKKAACATITAQLNAFDRNDYDAATALEAPGMAHSSNAPEQLRGIVQSFYPEFAHYKSVQFEEAKCNHERNEMSVHILLTGKDKFTVSAYYFIYIIDGKYLIGGVNGGEHPGRPRFNRRFYRPDDDRGPGRIGPGSGRPLRGPYSDTEPTGPSPDTQDYHYPPPGPPSPSALSDASGRHRDADPRTDN